MTAVTDPDLIRKLDAGGEVTDPALIAQLNASAGITPSPTGPAAIPGSGTAPAAVERDPFWTKQLPKGIQASLQNTAGGLYDTAGFLLGPAAKPFKMLNEYATSKGYPIAPTEQQLASGKAYTKEYPLAKGVETATDIGTSIIPVVGAEAAGAKVLTQAAPLINKVGSVAPGTANFLQAATKAAPTLAANTGWAAATAPSGQKADAAEGALYGTVYGNAAAKSAGFLANKGKQAYNYLADEMGTSVGSVGQRAGTRIVEKIGDREADRVVAALRDPKANSLPMTTAGTAESMPLAQIEATMPKAPALQDKYGSIQRETWERLADITKRGKEAESLGKDASDIFAEGQALMNKVPLSQANRKLMKTELEAIEATAHVKGKNAEAQQLVDRARSILDDREANMGALAQMRSDLRGNSNPTATKVRDLIDEYLNGRTKGQWATILEGFSGVKSMEEGATAARGIYRKFMDPGEIPKGSGALGTPGTKVGPNRAIPKVTPESLNRAVGFETRKHADRGPGISEYLDEDMVRKANELSASLRRSRIVDTVPGQDKIAGGAAKEPVEAALNTSQVWFLKPLLKQRFRDLDAATMARAEDAIADPSAFLKLMDLKRQRKQSIASWERGVENLIRGVTAGGAQIGANKNAP